MTTSTTTTRERTMTAQPELELLARATSRRTEHEHTGRGSCRACRWFEVAIYRDRFGTYHVTTAGRSTLEGETDRVREESMTSPHAVIDLLAMREDARTYLPWTSRKALHEAAEIDLPLGEAMDDFDNIHGVPN